MANSKGRSSRPMGLRVTYSGIRAQVAARLPPVLGALDDAGDGIGNLAVGSRADAQVVTEIPVVEVVGTAGAGLARSPIPRTARVPLRPARSANATTCPRRYRRPGCVGGAAANKVPGSMVRWYCDRCVGCSASAARTSASASAAVCPGSAYMRSRLKFVRARGVQFFGRPARFVRGMDATQRLELTVVEALRAQRHPADTGRAIFGEASAFDGPRIRFQRDFDVRHETQSRARVIDQVADGGGRKQAGRTTAQENAAELAARRRRRPARRDHASGHRDNVAREVRRAAHAN